MGCAGNDRIITPNLDSLSRAGVMFSNAYCPSPLCVPSRTGFMTGRYPSETKVWSNEGILSSQIPTFAHALGVGGYETVLCGRMHFLGHDQFHGFEKRIMADCQQGLNIDDDFTPLLSPEIEGSGYNRTNGQTKYAVEVSGYGHTGYQSYDEAVTKKAMDFIGSRKPEERPYCLVVGLMLPHNPLICEKDLFDYYFNNLPIPKGVSKEYIESLHPAVKKWRERRKVDELTPEQNHRALASYYGLVTELDRNVGNIMEAVRNLPDPDNTVIIYCSDHGDMACEHGMWWKSSFYNGSVRVPLIVSWPKAFHQDCVVDSIVNLLDVGPTLLDIAGAPKLPNVSGRSFLPFLTDDVDSVEWNNETFSEFPGYHGDQPSCMIRMGPWKLIYYHEFSSYQLFNEAEDPEELHDRRDDPTCAQVVEKCLQAIEARWSGVEVLKGMEKQQLDQEMILRCGHKLLPHKIKPFIPPDGCNEFDYNQL